MKETYFNTENYHTRAHMRSKYNLNFIKESFLKGKTIQNMNGLHSSFVACSSTLWVPPS